METLRRGNANRSKAATTLNFSSSRSHSVFCVTLQTPVAAADQSAKPSTSATETPAPHAVSTSVGRCRLTLSNPP